VAVRPWRAPGSDRRRRLLPFVAPLALLRGPEPDLGGWFHETSSALFVFVQLIPAIPVLVGGLLPSLGRSRLYFAAGVGIGVLTTALIWTLEP